MFIITCSSIWTLFLERIIRSRKAKSMKHYLKANKWQVGSGQHVCKACLDEMTERILETVNDDSVMLRKHHLKDHMSVNAIPSEKVLIPIRKECALGSVWVSKTNVSFS